MRNPIVGTTIAAAAMLAAGCMMDGDSMDMTGWAGAVGTHVDELGAAQAQHETAIRSAGSLEAMHAMERGHADAVDSRMGAIGSMMADMGRMCSHTSSGAMPDLAAMTAMMDEALAESRNHAAAMNAAPDVATARAEESRHHDTMAGVLLRMRAGADAMMSSGASYRCSMSCCGH